MLFGDGVCGSYLGRTVGADDVRILAGVGGGRLGDGEGRG